MAAPVHDASAAGMQLEARRLDGLDRALVHNVELEPAACGARAGGLGDRFLLVSREPPVDDSEHVEVASRRREVAERGRAVHVDPDEALVEHVLEALRQVCQVFLDHREAATRYVKRTRRAARASTPLRSAARRRAATGRGSDTVCGTKNGHSATRSKPAAARSARMSSTRYCRGFRSKTSFFFV